MNQPNETRVSIDEDMIAHLAELNRVIDGLSASIEDKTGERKAILEDMLVDAKPREIMPMFQVIAEKLRVTPSRIMKWTGEQINRGDTTIENDEGEKIGVLQLADIFEVGERGHWLCIAKDKVVWFMKDVEPPHPDATNGRAMDKAYDHAFGKGNTFGTSPSGYEV